MLNNLVVSTISYATITQFVPAGDSDQYHHNKSRSSGLPSDIRPPKFCKQNRTGNHLITVLGGSISNV